MKRWQAFLAVCGHLRAGLPGARPLAIAPQPSELLIEFSSRHLVTPALAWCLRDAADVPADLRDYLAAVLSLNTARNEAVLDGLARIAGALNAAGIVPVLLKGAAYLVEDLYPVAGARVLADIDLLVDGGETEQAVAALQGTGFVMGPATLPPTHHHLPMMRDHTAQLAVEIHTRIEHRQPDMIAPPAWFRANARPHPFRGLRVLLPDPTRMAAHNVIHGQLNHANDREGRIGLRDLLDLAMIRARHESAIDWPELGRRFSKAGEGEMLATYLAFAESLLGLPAPPLTCTPRPAALEDFRRSVDPAAQWRDDELERRVELLPASGIRHESGYCWQIGLPPGIPSGDSPERLVSSTLELFEDGKPLGPPHSTHDLIRQQGQGAFSHWGHDLYFSTPDNADPRSSGRRYSVAVRIPAAAPVTPAD